MPHWNEVISNNNIIRREKTLSKKPYLAMKNNTVFSFAVALVLLILTYQVCGKAIPLLNGTTDVDFHEGIVLLITACVMWLGFIFILLRSAL